MLNGRQGSLIARNMLLPSNYLALARAPQVYERPVEAVARYFLGSGSYPCSVGLRTPIGRQAVTLFCSHDAITVHEIFCRQDYNFPAAPQVVVDVGSNIGISALYFLTRSASAYCDLYEPDPRNVEKLLTNLSAFRDRFTLHETAVADAAGTMPFYREPTGRYGRLGVPDVGRELLTVRVEHINTVLDSALSRRGIIDLLKIDSEGSELATIHAIDPGLREHIRHIVIECRDHNIALDGFQTAYQCDAVKFTNRVLGAAA